jgi:hypothetical protein
VIQQAAPVEHEHREAQLFDDGHEVDAGGWPHRTLMILAEWPMRPVAGSLPSLLLLTLAAIVFGSMLVELRAARNERAHGRGAASSRPATCMN